MKETNAYRRKKEPAAVRRRLLDAAADLAEQHGLGAVTVQAVSEAADVTKGGLFHHFPSKQALVLAVFDDLMDQFGAEIDAYMALDREPRGRFTRAYVRSTFEDPVLRQKGQRAALHVSIFSDADLRRRWCAWFARRLDQHEATDGTKDLEVVRLAADGAWFALMLQEDGWPAPDMSDVCERLLRMTYPRASGTDAS